LHVIIYNLFGNKISINTLSSATTRHLHSFEGSRYRYSRNKIVIIITIYLLWSWATCSPVPVSRIRKYLQRSTMIPSASWGVVFHYPG